MVFSVILVLFGHSHGLRQYGQVFNYNKHSYLMSAYDYYVYNGYFYCQYDNHYSVDIQDQQENDALASVIFEDRTIGVYRLGETSGQFYSEHRWELLSYSNWDPNDPGSKSWSGVKMMARSGMWRLASKYNKEFWICEDDHISPNGINITSGKKINIPYDSMVSFRGHTYYIYKAARDYGTARQICHSDHNGYIFIPNDGTENCAVHEIVFGPSFVGITNLGNNRYMTEKNYLATYLPWSSLNQIGKECVLRDYVNGEFSTEECIESGHVVCELDSVMEGATPKDCSEMNKHHYFSQIFYFQNNSFYVFDFLSSRSEASSVCAQRNAILYAPFNSEENCAVFENVEFDIGINYGSVYLNHVLMRGDKLESNYTNWDVNYPRDSQTYGCVYAQYASGKWINDKCQNTRFICYKNDENYNYSNINCTNQFFHSENQTYSVRLSGKTYTIFGAPSSYHDSARLCAQFGLSLIKTTSKYIITELNKEIINQRFYMDYRVLWNDTTLTWLGDTPPNTLWAPNEPFYNDDGIVCITVAQNGSWIASRCTDPHMTVCVGDHSLNPTSTSGSSKTTIALGVGIFFAIFAVLGLIMGLFIYKRKKSPQLNILNSFGSFRKKNRGSLET